MPPKQRVGNVEVKGNVEVSGSIEVDGERFTAEDVRRWKEYDERLAALESQ